MVGFSNNNQNNNQTWNTGFMDAINIVSFLIGLQNLELNITAQDLSEESNRILDDIHNYFVKQDEHLTMQDQHLIEQDMRLDRLEQIIVNNRDFFHKTERR